MEQKLLSLISGGIDSPVASYLMYKQGYDLEYVFFYSEPYMSPQNRKAAEDMVKQLKKVMKKNKITMHIVPHGPIMKQISTEAPANLRCILCRRMMFRVASAIAKKRKCDALVTGENLAQVASQTLPNMVLEHEVATLPVLNPLLGFDKIDTTKIAYNIGTLPIAKEHSCCGLVPRKPRTRGRSYEIQEAEKNLDVENIILTAVNTVKSIQI
tara:strand:+ start:945 stop:1580 length:636 start_codon:yes stop_codon:yes gene_type:complete